MIWCYDANVIRINIISYQLQDKGFYLFKKDLALDISHCNNLMYILMQTCAASSILHQDVESLIFAFLPSTAQK